MRSKQYFTSIKNNPHEISTDPLLVNSNIDIKRAWKRLLSIPQSEALAIAYHS